jgi:hypothetical protein
MNLSSVPLPDREPERRAVQRIVAWLSDNTGADAIEVERLARDAKEVTLADLLRAFIYLQSQGVVRVSYRPVSPYTKQVVRRDFSSPNDLRKAMEIRDASEHVFDGWDAEFVQVYVPEERWR